MVNKQKNLYLKLILKDGTIHPSQDKIISAFIYNFDNKEKHYYNFSHPDLESNLSLKEFKNLLNKNKVFISNKKRNKYYINDVNLYDVHLLSFLKDGNILDYPTHLYTNQLRSKHNNINDKNIIIPYVIHQSEFDSEVELLKDIYKEDTETYCFKFYNNVVSDTLFEVEKNGLAVDKSIFNNFFDVRVKNNIVYSEYNIYNPTGRPSNKFDGINYVALNKEDGCRKSFISRYKNGKLLMVDFTGFHPYLVSNLIKYTVPDEETIYEHLAKQYYNIKSVDKDTLNNAKKLTMINLYGQIDKQYVHIPYFEKVEKAKDKYWKQFIEKGYVQTPIYKRKITNKHILDPNKNKLFAYIIQATETEHGISILNECIKYIADKPIKPILYIYDSILFDLDESITQEQIDDLVKIIRNNKFKVRVYIGNNYNDLKLV